MAAWEAYKSTDDYAITKRWAGHDDQATDGSLWASFERGWLAAGGLPQFAPVVAPAPEERSPYDSGLCCMARHASAKPPWTCDCPCHTAPAPETQP